ncbi:hypothetical protein HKBW3S03_01634, partial [Candidatus Hakubella thermalkaliphila]
AW